MSDPALPGEGASDYERYLKIPTLLSALKPKTELAHRDEVLFQVVHHSAELWFHQILWDFEEIERRLHADQPLPAAKLLRRSAEIVQILTRQLHVLETMLPWDYHAIRLALGRGSGQESPGFQAILREAPKLEAAFLSLLERRGVELYDVVTNAEAHYDLVEMENTLVDFDTHFHLWRQNHLAFVKRMIGPGQRSLKGYGVDMLEKLIVGNYFFPTLLAVRDEMTLKSGTSPPGKQPGAALR